MGQKKKSGVNTAESRVSPTKNHSKGKAIRFEAKPTREPSVDLRGELLKLHHDNKTAFVELVAGMVELLVELDFREIAAMYSSWPVNVPALRVRSRSKKKESIKPFHQRSRQEQCEYIMDDLLQVGSGLQRELRPAKTPYLTNEMTGLAVEIANIMTGIHAHPDRSGQLWSVCGIAKGIDEIATLRFCAVPFVTAAKHNDKYALNYRCI